MNKVQNKSGIESYINGCLNGKFNFEGLEKDIVDRLRKIRLELVNYKQKKQQLATELQTTQIEENKLAGQFDVLVSLLLDEDEKRNGENEMVEKT